MNERPVLKTIKDSMNGSFVREAGPLRPVYPSGNSLVDVFGGGSLDFLVGLDLAQQIENLGNIDPVGPYQLSLEIHITDDGSRSLLARFPGRFVDVEIFAFEVVKCLVISRPVVTSLSRAQRADAATGWEQTTQWGIGEAVKLLAFTLLRA